MRFLSGCLLLALPLACGGAHATPAPPTTDAGVTGDVFVAFADDFQNFESWRSFDVTATAQPGTVHPDAQLIEYLKTSPPSGSTEWPLGTLIVKEGTDGVPATRKFFAMVKRGGGFNPGAPGWEWFELQNTTADDGTVQIVWRGVGPPAGDTYGGDPTAGCNSCHTACGNDAVCAPALALTGF